MKDNTRKNVLLLCHYYQGVAGAIVDHIFAFERYSKNEYFILSNLGDLPDWLELTRFDALILHYSLIASHDSYISPAGRKRIREFSGFKAAFVQDDYRWIDDTVNALSYLGIHALFPLTGPDIMDQVYCPDKLPNVRKETVLTGYVPLQLVETPVRSYQERAIDVGYRARKLPAWMGSHTLQKWQIAEKFLQDAPRYGLNVDISCNEKDRIYEDKWITFLTNCKATLGTESGASLCDFTGNIQREVEAHLERDPNADFETLRNLYFRDEDCKIMMNVISPRCFEAAALRTLMILYEGNYSGVLVPWRHYVPLKHDHSNMEEVVSVLQTPETAQKIIDRAYEEIAKNENYSYAAMVCLVDRVMDEVWTDSLVPGHNYYLQEEFEWFKEHDPQSSARMANRPFGYSLYLRVDRASQRSRLANFAGNKLMDVINEVPLGLLLSPKSMSIRWDTDSAAPPHWFEVQGLREGRVIFDQSQANVDRRAFQFFELASTFPRIDLVRIKLRSDCCSARVLAISINETVVNPMLRLIITLLVASWRRLPEGIRKVLRPTVHKIKPLLKEGLLRSQRIFRSSIYLRGKYLIVSGKWLILKGIYHVWRPLPGTAKNWIRRLFNR